MDVGETILVIGTIVAAVVLACVTNERGKEVESGLAVALLDIVPLSFELVHDLTGLPMSEFVAGVISSPHVVIPVLLLASTLDAVGGYVDARLAWRKFGGKHALSPTERMAVAKYGSKERYKHGCGRYFYDREHIFYATGCNVTGALCTVTLAFIMASLGDSLPAFVLAEGRWFNCAGLVFATALIVVVVDLRAKQHGHSVVLGEKDGKGRTVPSKTSAKDGTRLDLVYTVGENPDNYLLDHRHLHVWGNTVHLFLTFSYVILSLVCILPYAFSMLVTTRPVVLGLEWIALDVFVWLFFWFASASPWAEKYGAVGSSIWGKVKLVLFVIPVLSFMCGFSWTQVLLVLVSAGLFALTVCIQNRSARRHGRERASGDMLLGNTPYIIAFGVVIILVIAHCFL